MALSADSRRARTSEERKTIAYQGEGEGGDVNTSLSGGGGREQEREGEEMPPFMLPRSGRPISSYSKAVPNPNPTPKHDSRPRALVACLSFTRVEDQSESPGRGPCVEALALQSSQLPVVLAGWNAARSV